MVVTVPVIALESDRRGEAAETLALAFHADPVYERLIPDAEARMRTLSRLWRAVLKYGLLYGEVLTTPDLAGVASWLPPGETASNMAHAMRAGIPLALGAFPADARRTFLAVLGELDPLQEELMPEPHWYLAVLGVRPDSQGRGVGTALVEHVVERASATGVPCYLEAINEQNAAFYARRGFEVVQEGVVSGEGIPYWVMATRHRKDRANAPEDTA